MQELAYIKQIKNTKETLVMVVIPAIKPSPSLGEKAILEVLKTMPGVVQAIQTEAGSKEDQAGCDIIVETSATNFPSGDRTVKIQVKGMVRQMRRFKEKHLEDRIVPITFRVRKANNNEYLKAILTFVFERPVQQIQHQQELNKFLVMLNLLHQHLLRRRIKHYTYAGRDCFVIRKGRDQFSLHWRRDDENIRLGALKTVDAGIVRKRLRQKLFKKRVELQKETSVENEHLEQLLLKGLDVLHRQTIVKSYEKKIIYSIHTDSNYLIYQVKLDKQRFPRSAVKITLIPVNSSTREKTKKAFRGKKVILVNTQTKDIQDWLLKAFDLPLLKI